MNKELMRTIKYVLIAASAGIIQFSTFTLLNEYDGDRLTRQERYDEEGTMLSRVSFEYDDEGLLKRAVFLTPGATTTATVLYTNGPIYAPNAVE